MDMKSMVFISGFQFGMILFVCILWTLIDVLLSLWFPKRDFPVRNGAIATALYIAIFYVPFTVGAWYEYGTTEFTWSARFTASWAAICFYFMVCLPELFSFVAKRLEKSPATSPVVEVG